MKKVCVVGCFAFNHDFADGQTIKTWTVNNEFTRIFGDDNVFQIDTFGRGRHLFRIFFALFKALKISENIVILPGENGLRIIAPILMAGNFFFKRTIIYDVIGGWLPEFLMEKKFLTKCLKKFDAIFVETESMKKKMEDNGFINVDVIPNCKELKIIGENEVKITNHTPPYKLCTFSRIMKEKGIENAINAVIAINKQYGFSCFELSIYGKVYPAQKQWFDTVSSQFPSYISYKGIIPYNESTLELKQYDALLFPTYYEGEGFAGTIIDAFASGVPVIASDWKYNSEVVSSGKTGILIKVKDDVELIHAIELIEKLPDKWNSMKKTCLIEAKKYLPHNAMSKMIGLIEKNDV